MKHKINKMAAIFIASIFALSGLGVAYAAWTDTITIDGTAQTGLLKWEFASCDLIDDDEPINYGGDYPTTNPDWTCLPGFAWNDEINPATGDEYGFYWELDKNVAWGEQLRVDTTGDDFKDTLEVTLHNVYPCNFNRLSFYVKNVGTIPLRVDHVVINGNTYYSGVPFVEYDLSGNGINDFEIQWGNNWGVQIEPGGRSPEFSFWMHTLQDEGEGVQGQTGFTFTIQIVCIQWNEYPSGP